MLRIMFIGRTKERFIDVGINEYLKRLKRFTKLEIIEIKKVHLDFRNDFVIVFDVNGKNISSEELAQLIKGIEKKNITIILGDENGLTNKIKERANILVSISKMTFTHELARLIAMEQIYRAFTIINNVNYHK